MSENNNMEDTSKANQLCKSLDNNFSDTMVRKFNELIEMMTQVVSKAQDSVRMEMRKQQSEMTEMKSTVGDIKV